MHIQLEDSAGSGQYVRTLLRGSNNFFVILVTDTGFVVEVPNAPVQARGPNAVTLADVSVKEHCVLLHTSNKCNTYHFSRTPEGKIIKVPRSSKKPSLDENTVKLT